MASFLAASLAKGTYGLFAKDRNILIPLDDVKNTKVITDKDLKKNICGNKNDSNKKKYEKEINELKNIIKDIKKLRNKNKSNKNKNNLNNLDKILQRF